MGCAKTRKFMPRAFHLSESLTRQAVGASAAFVLPARRIWLVCVRQLNPLSLSVPRAGAISVRRRKPMIALACDWLTAGSVSRVLRSSARDALTHEAGRTGAGAYSSSVVADIDGSSGLTSWEVKDVS